MNYLWEANYKGNGVKQDYVEAAKWAQKSAEAGTHEGMVNLGVMYAYGQGVKKDLVEAYKWFTIAFKQGNSRAGTYRNELAEQLGPEDIFEGRKRANEYKVPVPKRAAQP